MKRQNPSIFNDIVGPVMIGPSSSHTCAPSRLGYLSQQLLNSKLTRAEINFAQKGAYTNMYKGQRSDMGFINGLLGNRPEDPKLRDAFKLADKEGVDVKFIVTDYEPIKPNIAIITLYGENEEKFEVHTDSTGGGTVKIFKINGFDTSIVGDAFELLIKANLDYKDYIENTLNNLYKNNEGVFLSEIGNEVLINYKLREHPTEKEINILLDLDGVLSLKVIKPILKVLSNRSAKLPFKSAQDLEDVCTAENKKIWELGIEYEMARSGWSKEKVISYMEYIIDVFENSVKKGLSGNFDMNGIIKPTSGSIEKYIESDKNPIDMGVLSKVIPWSMATMEYSSAMGLVICAPTGGSAGVFPGAVLGVANHLNYTMEQKIKSLFTTSALGIAMSVNNNYSAELYGCQVEPGAASAMAAGAIVEMIGGSVKQSLEAASCAIQNILGTICDPVAGLVQIPCINRNAMSSANALVCAMLIMGGYDPLIPLDQSAETMFRVGEQLPSELRCTCNGGLCTTPRGKQLAQEQSERDNNR